MEKNVDDDDDAIIELFYSKISGLNTNSGFKNSLNAFEDLEGNKYFPQIFIYNYDKLKTAGKIGTNNPILAIFYTGDETQNSVKAYKLNSAGK